MSDVSGIPNMGFGGGNFFAPQFSYNPQMSAGQASAAYMPAENYAQNVTNNLFSSGGGFGRQTDYYSGLGAQYSAAGMSPYGVFGEGGGGGGASPYQTSANVFDTGASSFQGGGGSSGMGGSIYSGGGFSGGSYGNYGGDSFGGAANPFPNMSMPGGLGMPASSPSGAQPLDWGNLFGGGGGPRNDPSPGMAMPGGLGSPMSTPQTQQQPSIDWGSVGAAANSSAPYTSGIAPDLSGGQTFAGGAAPADPFPGMSMPGGLGSPMTTPEPGAGFSERFDALGDNAPAAPHTYDFAPMFEGGGGGGFGSGGTESQSFGGNAGSLGGDPFSYIQDPNAAKAMPGPSAEDMAGQGRDRLAELLGGTTPEQAAETTKAVEATREAAAEPSMADFVSPANEYDKFQQPATYRTGYDADIDFLAKHGAHNTKMRPGETGLRGIDENIHLSAEGPYKSLTPELAARLRTVAEAYEKATGRRANFGETSRGSDVQKVYWDRYQSGEGGLAASPESSRHRQGNAMDIPRGDFRDWADRNGAQFGIVFPFANDKVHVQLSPNYTGPNFAQSDAPRPPMSIPVSEGQIPLPAARPAEANIPIETRPGPNQGQDITPPPANIPDPRVSSGGFNSIDAAANAPVKHSGLELARANVDTPIEKIAMERGGQKAVDQVSSMAVGMTPRQLMQSYGGMFMSRAEPLFASLGITRSDFEKAITMPQTKQDLKMRFGEGGGLLGPYPAYTGPEAAPGGGFPDFSQSTNIDDRRDYSGLRSALGALTNNVLQAFDPRDMIERNTPIPSAGSDMSRQAGVPELNARLEGDPAIRQWYKQTDEYDRLTQDTGAAAPRFMGGGAAEGTALPGGMPSSQDLLGYTPQQWSAGDYPASFNERFGGEAAAPESTSMADFQSPASGYGSFQGAASPENRLEAQRAGFAAGIRDNPEKALQLAARLYSEDRNSPASRQAILEAMLNAQQASGRDPFDPKYYPKNTQQYRDALAKLSGNNDLLDRIYQEMETPFSGSNRSNYATDWASAKTAADERRYTTSTWTSPTDEQFFRKDISNDWTGPGRAAQNQKWYQTTTGRAR